MKNKNNQKIIVFEGIDGVGKSTQARLLYFALKRKGVSVNLHHFPSAGKIGTFVRGILKSGEFDKLDEKSRAMLTVADFYDQYSRENDKVNYIIFDRYIHSNFVSNDNIERSWIESLHKFAPVPDIVFFLNCDVEIIKKRKDTDFGAKNLERQKDFNLRYKKLFENTPKIEIDASKKREDIHDEIIKIISAKI